MAVTGGELRIVCLHGLGRTPCDWDAVRPALAELGAVACPPVPRADVATAARAVVIAPGSILVGHSMGAVVARRLAADPRHAVAGLVIANGFHPPARNGRTLPASVADYARHRAAIVRELAARRHRPTPRAGTAAALGDLVRATLRGTDAGGTGRDVPTLVLHTRDDHYVPVDFAVAAAARHPAWTLRLLDGGGHDPHLRRPDAWLAAVLPWLADRAGSR